jgi:hypothetical protein
VLNGTQTFQDGVHLTHGDMISVVGGYIASGDDALAFGIDSTSATETWDDEALTNVTVTGTVVNSAKATAVKVYYGLNTATGMPFSGTYRGKIDGVTVRGVTGKAGQAVNGGVYVVDTTVLTFTTSFANGATSGTLSSAFTGATGTYYLTFSNGNVRSTTLTNGSTACSFAALSATATASVSAVDPARIKNVDIEATLQVGSASNDGVNSAGIYARGVTNLRVAGTYSITDTASGSHFAAGNIQLVMGVEAKVNVPAMPAGPGLSFYNCDGVNVHDSELVGGAGSGRGSVEITGCRSVKVHDANFKNIPSNHTGVIVQSSGSGDFANTLQIGRCTATKATGATGTRLYGQQSGAAGFVQYLDINGIDIRGGSNANAIDAVFNSTGITPDEISVDNVRGFGGGVNRSTNIPLAVAYSGTWTPTLSAYRGNRLTQTLTGNTTVAAPTGMVVGTRIVFELTQDGTGSRTVTWNAIFKFVVAAWADAGAASTITSIEFEWNGTNWIQKTANRWI